MNGKKLNMASGSYTSTICSKWYTWNFSIHYVSCWERDDNCLEFSAVKKDWKIPLEIKCYLIHKGFYKSQQKFTLEWYD